MDHRNDGLLASNFNQSSPTARKNSDKQAVSERAERERVEKAKINFQRVFATSVRSEFDGLDSKAIEKKTWSAVTPNAKARSIEQCYSDEISNQDERCQRELGNVNFYHVNSDISDASQCSIEPNSSLDVDPGGSTTKTGMDFVQSVFSAENSCNAVDHLIDTRHTRTVAIGVGELSFDGIIDSMSNVKADELKKEQQGLKLRLLENEKNLMHVNEKSPDLFEESDEGDDDEVVHPIEVYAKNAFAEADDGNHRRAHIFKSEKAILGQIQSSLSGLLPPPSVTILQYDILELLAVYRKNEDTKHFASAIKTIGPNSEFAPTHRDIETKQLQWPHCMDAKAHGILYNRSLYSENIEIQAMRFAERYIGAETSSTFNANSPSSCKKRSMRFK